MRQNKMKKLVMIAVILCINAMPLVTYAADSKINGGIIAQSNVQINDNWLSREVASQLGKKVKKLTEQDFLNIKKIDLRYKNINNDIPKEIGLLKNLEYLDLGHSKISGQVPESIGDLPSLTYLDLGDNKLSKLPKNVIQRASSGQYIYCDLESNKFRLDKGWYYLKGKLCYLDKNGKRVEGKQTIDGKEYIFNEDGNVRNGWETDIDKNWYYYDMLNGLVKDNWKQISGSWYYFNKDGIMQKGLQNIKGVNYYLNDNGAMVSGLQKINNNNYYFTGAGTMQYGWLYLENKLYYLDDSTGIMILNAARVIDGKKYKFSSDGSLITNEWLDSYTYVQADGQTVDTYYNYAHSNANYQLFNYMTNVNNQMSVDSAAIRLHGGETSNNCVYFLSEVLRRIGVGIPNSVSNTYQLENQLKSIGFVYSYDLSQLKPGDIVFTNNYTHVYIFMCWDRDGYAYIVDNQRTSYGNLVLHRRQVLLDTDISDRATHFYYYR
jgi:hypothetical protein